MTIAFQCRCGTLQGEIDPRRVYARATCYCRDCQAFARALGREDVLDPQGGSDVVAMSPAGVRFTRGTEQLACLSLSPKGLLRWHSRCCATPIGNTPREARMAYVGMLGGCLVGSVAEVDAALGPSRIALNIGSARGRVAPTRLRSFAGVLRIVRGVLGARLGGQDRQSPFFIGQPPRPVVAPTVLTRSERSAADPP